MMMKKDELARRLCEGYKTTAYDQTHISQIQLAFTALEQSLNYEE